MLRQVVVIIFAVILPFVYSNGLPMETYGTVVGNVSGRTNNNQLVRLAKVFCDDYETSQNCAWVLENAFAPGDCTDNNGNFVIENVEQGRYVAIVGMPENNDYNVIYNNPGDIMWVQEGKTIDMGSFLATTNATWCPAQNNNQ